MRFNRVVSIITLVAFIPLAVGCSSHKAIQLDSDPDSASDPLKAGKEITITAYTTYAEGTEPWHGTVQAAPPDSLQFSRTVTSGNTSAADTSTLTLARADVKSLSVTDKHPGRSAALAIAIIVACGAVVLVAAMASMEDEVIALDIK